MQLLSRRAAKVIRSEPEDYVVHWATDIMGYGPMDAPPPEDHVVGRVLARELEHFDAQQGGINPYDAADEDGAELEAAYAALLDKDGNLLEDDFEQTFFNIVYIQRFELHPDFTTWRSHVLNAFCQQFSESTLFVCMSDLLNEKEALDLGFDPLPPTQFPGSEEANRNIRFGVRTNWTVPPIEKKKTPRSLHVATADHVAWLESKGPWGSP